MKKIWGSFDHKVHHVFKKNYSDRPKTLILAVSGGLDSMALMHCLLKLSCYDRLIVAHFHHGPSSNPQQWTYRNQALKLVRQTTAALTDAKGNLVFESEQSSIELKSENEMRKARQKFFDHLVHQYEGIVLTAHHADDWLETVLLKMIRGVGPDKLFSFQQKTEKIFRPFLEIPKSEILHYAKIEKLTWLEDPSNADNLYLRNWLRNEWLTKLKTKSSRGAYRFSQSFHRLAEAFQTHSTFNLVYKSTDKAYGIDRLWFNTLNHSEKCRAMALFLNSHQVREFSTGQLKEIVKRLDKNQKELTFTLVGRKWVINAMQIMLELNQ